MKQLLENDLLIYKRRQSGHLAHQFVFSDKMLVGDAVACRQCPPFFSNNCEEKVFVVETHTLINMIEYEEYINRAFAGSHKQCCDLILYDGDKIIFVDMTCSDESLLQAHFLKGDVVQGKRAKCRAQIQDSIDFLYEVPSIASYIDSKIAKRAILAYRIKDITPFNAIKVEDHLSKSEKAWLSLMQEYEQRDLSIPMEHGFVYQSVKYPLPYQWGENINTD